MYVIGIADSACLDPALLRQGRLGLHVEVPRVGAAEAREIYAELAKICAPGVLAGEEQFDERLEAAGDEILGCDLAGLFLAASE